MVCQYLYLQQFYDDYPVFWKHFDYKGHSNFWKSVLHITKKSWQTIGIKTIVLIEER